MDYRADNICMDNRADNVVNAENVVKKANNIMIQGTSSSVGKSVITTALCRILREDGLSVAPFKAQNMGLNTYITADGLEMSIAQAVQAEAADVAPIAEMNPVLLKPMSDRKSLVIVMGKPVRVMTAMEYGAYKVNLVDPIREAYEFIANSYDAVVIEGAGSPAEINLNENDIVNMGMARIADAPVLLVGDIDRGGVFAAIVGTLTLLPEDDRKRVKGIIINKFRGDMEILKPGIAMLENIVKIPVLGVVPYTRLRIDEEDSLTERHTSPTQTAPMQTAPMQTAPNEDNEITDKEAEYKRIADIVRECVDIQAIRRIMKRRDRFGIDTN